MNSVKYSTLYLGTLQHNSGFVLVILQTSWMLLWQRSAESISSYSPLGI
jgi:hypothetical protein